MIPDLFSWQKCLSLNINALVLIFTLYSSGLCSSGRCKASEWGCHVINCQVFHWMAGMHCMRTWDDILED